MRAVAAHRRDLADAMRCRRDTLPSRWRSRAGLGALEPFRAVRALGQVCLIALGVVSRWVRYLVLVTFWGAVLVLLSHLQQASPRGPSCLLNQSRPPVIRGPMHYSMQGSWTAGSKIPPAVAPRIGGLGRTGCLQLGPTVPQLPVHAHRYKQRLQQDVSTFSHVPCLIQDNHL